MRKRTKRPIVLRLIIMLMTLFIILSGVCLFMVFQDNISEQYTLYERDDSFFSMALKSSVFGKSFTVNEAQMNTLLYDTLCKPEEKDQLHVTNLSVRFHADAPCDIYARVKKGETALAVSAKAVVSLSAAESRGYLTLSNVKIGELPVPEFIVSDLLKRIADCSDILLSDRSTLIVKTSYTHDFESFSITLSLLQFDTGEGNVDCRTNSLSYEAAKAVIRYAASEEGRKKLGGLFDMELDSVEEKFNELKKQLLSVKR